MTEHEPIDHAAMWEQRYQERGTVWSGKVNPTMADAVDALVPGRALDVGCGEGGDALWLAQRGWHVLGVDISPTAVGRASAQAQQQGLDALARFEAVDVLSWQPAEPFDLVVSSFLHSAAQFPRLQMLARMASWVAQEGRLVVVSHAEPPPWSPALQAHRHQHIAPEAEWEELALGSAWELEQLDTVLREAQGPDGELATLKDGLIVARRLP